MYVCDVATEQFRIPYRFISVSAQIRYTCVGIVGYVKCKIFAVANLSEGVT